MMNSFAKPCNSLLPKNLSTALTGQRFLLAFCLLVFASNAASAQEVAASPPSETKEERAASSGSGAITGQVVSDEGRPLADAVVYFNRAYSRTAGPPQTATTDSEGRFRSSGLEPGLYIVNAMVPGFALAEIPIDPSEFKYYRPGDSVNITLVKGGVITGTVRDANGEPVVAVAVRATRLRDNTGRSTTRGFGFFPERMTDDRGIYRIYGLPPGTYVVSAGGGQRNFGVVNPYEGDAPTFFPSSPRDTAAEVPVRSGEEATGIDIRYRGERGHTISGAVTGFIDTSMNSGVPILLRQASGGGFEATTFVMPGNKPGFSFSGISDGEYEVMAQQWGNATTDSAASLPQRITIKGADVSGVQLALSPLASIAGRVTLEAPPKETCTENRNATLSETAITARREEKTQAEELSRIPFFSASGGIPDEKGEFIARNLMPGSYRISVRLPSDAWYVRSILLPKASAAPQPTAPAKAAQTKGAPAAASAAALGSLVTLRAGERATNVNIQIAQDAAILRGRVTSATEGAEGASLPANLKVYLVPTERERAEDVLRYGEASIGSDGTFTLTNIAPGRYWLIARPAPETNSPERVIRPLFWNAESRARLRRDAEAANTTLELQPCQRVGDYVLRFAAGK